MCNLIITHTRTHRDDPARGINRLCRQEVTLAGSQQLRAQGPAPADDVGPRGEPTGPSGTGGRKQ